MGALKFRPRWYSVPSLTLLLPSVGCFAALPFTAGSNLVWLAILGIAFFAFWVLTTYLSTVEVTSVYVRASGRSFRRTVVPRERIHAMHWTSNVVTLRDSDNGLLLQTTSFGWTGSQLLGIAEALGVRLYDHRTKRGFGKDVRVGKLVTRPPAN